MKTASKLKLPVPLVNGALLVHREITLGLGHVATVEIRYDGPSQPTPATGADWPPETDWPAAKMTLRLPAYHYWGYSFRLCHDLQNCGSVLGESTNENWGGDHYFHRDNVLVGTKQKTRRKAGTSLRQAAAELLREVIAELRPVQAHVAARAARLAQREATLLAGQDMRPVKDPSPAPATT